MTHADALKAFPAAEPGYIRYMIDLPEQRDEALYKVEVIAGKQMKVDCNRQWFNDAIRSHSIEGWGYTYLRVEHLDGPFSTRMGCPEQELRDAFVQAPPYMTDYNSKLPIVVYAAEGVDVRYRIWSTTADLSSVEAK